MIKGDFHVVEYLGWETTYTEIVPSDRLRSKSAEPPITPSTFFKFTLAVPAELQGFCADEKAADVHTEFMKTIEACHVRYLEDKVRMEVGCRFSHCLLSRALTGLLVIVILIQLNLCVQGVLSVISRQENSRKRAEMLQDMVLHHYVLCLTVL